MLSPSRGIEPRSPAWQAGILTTILTGISTTSCFLILIYWGLYRSKSDIWSNISYIMCWILYWICILVNLWKLHCKSIIKRKNRKTNDFTTPTSALEASVGGTKPRPRQSDWRAPSGAHLLRRRRPIWSGCGSWLVSSASLARHSSGSKRRWCDDLFNVCRSLHGGSCPVRVALSSRLGYVIWRHNSIVFTTR